MAPLTVRPRVAAPAVGVPRFAAAPAAVSRSSDRWEGEARAVAALAASRPAAPVTAPPTHATAAPRSRSMHRRPGPVRTGRRDAPRDGRPVRPARVIPPATGPPAGLVPLRPEVAALSAVLHSETSDSPQRLPLPVRTRLESLFGFDLRWVALHTGPVANAAALRLQARAFTVGRHIFLRAGESPQDVALLAHEVTHAVQQSALLPTAPTRGPPLSLSPAPAGMIQRESDDDSWVPDFVSDAASAVGGAVEHGFWYAVDTLAPREVAALLHEVRDVGFWGMLKNKLTSALDFVFAALRQQGGTPARIAETFAALLGAAKPILAALAAGDCEPLLQAVRDLGATLGQMAGDAWEEITTFLEPVGVWLADTWRTFGAPVVTFLTNFASDTWDWIQGLGERLWDLSEPVRDFYSGAWTEIKNLLGFGSGADEDGSAGLTGFITVKAGEVWDEVKTELQPVLEPIQRAKDAIASFLPLAAIQRLRDSVEAWVEQATTLADNMDEPDDVAENQDLLRDVILPGVRRMIGDLRGHIAAAGTWATEAVGQLTGEVGGFVTSLADHTLLAPFAGPLNWLSEAVTDFGAWATDKVGVLFAYADLALITLDHWLEPIFALLQRLVAALGDLMGRLGDVVLGPLLLVPRCIRDAIQDFIVTRILSQIPVFSQLVALPDLWARVEPAFRAIIVRVFRDGDLFGAAWAFFRKVLELLDVPPALLTNLIRNAAKAIRDILRDPLRFLRNLLSAMKAGLLQFVKNIGRHLLRGAVDWLLSGVRDAGVRLPDPFALTLGNVLDLVLQVLAITKEKVLQRIDALMGPKVGKRVRQVLAAGGKVLSWLHTLITEGPAGLWRHLRADLSSLWDKLLGFVIDYLVGKIVQQATIWIAKTLASGGLSVILDAIKAVYDALQVIAQYLRQLLEVVNSVCSGVIDIAKGVIARAADLVEDAASRLVPVMLAFLARTLGIGDLPVVIGEGIQRVRQTVENAIDALIKRTIKAVDWLKEQGRAALDAVREWWRQRLGFTNADGEAHTLSFRGDESAAVLTVESTPRPLVTYLADYETAKQPDATEKEVIRQIRTKVTKIENLKSRQGTRDRSSFNAEDGEKIRQLFTELAELLGRLRGEGKPPATVVSWSAPEEDGVSMRAEPLSLNPGPYAGSQPGEESKLWRLTSTRFPGKYVRGHLLNHHVHGPGTRRNLTPITIGANNRMERLAESQVKKAVLDEKKTLRFVVTVTSFHSSVPGLPASARLPAQLQLRADEIKRKGNAWETGRTVVSEPIASPLPN